MSKYLNEGLKERIYAFIEGDGARDIALIGIIILVGIGGFGLGRLSQIAESGDELSMVYATTTAAQDTLSRYIMPPEGLVVASRHGARYHFPWCSGAQRMNAGNMVWFKDIATAEKNGYTPAQNCPGLTNE